MTGNRIHCTVIEVPTGDEMVRGAARTPIRELSPLDDPLIAQLIDKYRLQGALADTLRFVADEAAGLHFSAPRFSPSPSRVLESRWPLDIAGWDEPPGNPR